MRRLGTPGSARHVGRPGLLLRRREKDDKMLHLTAYNESVFVTKSESSILALISTMATLAAGEYVIYQTVVDDNLAITFHGVQTPPTVQKLNSGDTQIVLVPLPYSDQLLSILSLLVLIITVACSGGSRTLRSQVYNSSSPRKILRFKLAGVMTKV